MDPTTTIIAIDGRPPLPLNLLTRSEIAVLLRLAVLELTRGGNLNTAVEIFITAGTDALEERLNADLHPLLHDTITRLRLADKEDPHA